MPSPPVPAPPQAAPAQGRAAALARAEARGRQVLLYAPDALLGGTFTCTRCGASALHPDLLDHLPRCRYSSPVAGTATGTSTGR